MRPESRADVRRSGWRGFLILVPPGLSVVLLSVDPALLVGAAVLSLGMLIAPPVLRAVACGLAVGCLSGPALEMPAVWLVLAAAAALGEGPRRIGVVPALVGAVLALTWGLDPSLWPVACGLAALAAVSAEPGDRSPSTVLLLMVLIGGAHSWRADARVREVPFEEAPALAERYGAAWLAPVVEERLREAAWLTEETSRRDRARLIAELGAGRVAFRSLGLEPLPTWERAALLHQVGRSVPGWFLGLLEPPDDPVVGPGAVFERAEWTEAERVVVPLQLTAGTEELVVQARGEFLLGEPELVVQVAGITLGPLLVPDEGDTWTAPVPLRRGVHRLTVAFTNPHSNAHSTRALYDVSVSLR